MRNIITPDEKFMTENPTKILPYLYENLSTLLDKKEADYVKNFSNNIRVKTALLLIVKDSYKYSKGLDAKQMHGMYLNVEHDLLERLNKVGINLNVEIDSSLNLEELKEKGVLAFINHQGGGLETYLSRTIVSKAVDKPVHWVLKDDLLKIPFYGEMLKRSEPIVIERAKEGEDGQKGQREKLESYSKQIAEVLKNNETVLFAYEGTRSKDGNLSLKHEGLSSVLKNMILRHIKTDDFVQILITVDTFTTMPKPMEKNPFGKIRSNSNLNVRIRPLDHSTPLRQNKSNNIFEIAKRDLIKMIIEKIQSVIKSDKNITF